MIAFEDPSHPGNGPAYHSGEPSHVKGCDRPAGTFWLPYWCFEHNVERIRRITRQLDEIAAAYERRSAEARTAHETAKDKASGLQDRRLA